MNYKQPSVILEQTDAVDKPVLRRSSKKFMTPLEYDIISNMVLKQYLKDDNIRFDLLLSIPQEDRIPQLTEENGKKRIHKLLLMIVKAFCFALPLPKTKKLSDTKMSALACDLMLSSYEDQLSLEDLILFFERAKQGRYGKIKSLLYHYQVMNMLEQYRQERHEAYNKWKDEKDTELKTLGPKDRICEEPKPIGDLFSHPSVLGLPEKMRG